MTRIDSLASTYLRASRLLGWLPEKLKTIHQALWLGVLDADSLNQVTRSGYSEASGFGSEDFNLIQGFWPWEASAVRTYFKDCENVLVAGAGGGREAIALSRLGFRVTAFDFSTDLTAACRRNAKKANAEVLVLDAPPDRLPEELDVFDGIIVGRGVYHHIPTRRRRIDFLRGFLEHARPQAPIFISDFFTRAAHSRNHQAIQLIANLVRISRFDPNRVELGDWLSICMQHAFVQEEIEAELAAAGFRTQLYAPSPFAPNSHLAHLVAYPASTL